MHACIKQHGALLDTEMMRALCACQSRNQGWRPPACRSTQQVLSLLTGVAQRQHLEHEHVFLQQVPKAHDSRLVGNAGHASEASELAVQRMLVQASSMGGSLRFHRSCRQWMRSIVSTTNGGRPPSAWSAPRAWGRIIAANLIRATVWPIASRKTSYGGFYAMGSG